ncbi:hypothetical protein [[Mycobacterium] nativiensis]|uniref:hypothetical protein n=1 Tax=[Mycobacterium] nativiensis TaxID=2855503 RepID=UPI002E77EB8A|nr:hypothetical protein [Mycolicibacter sp. MYC340]
MDQFDRQIVEYVRLWAPFGGPPEEEILPRFGLTIPQFNKRYRDVISALRANESTLPDDDRELLVTAQRVLSSPEPVRTKV